MWQFGAAIFFLFCGYVDCLNNTHADITSACNKTVCHEDVIQPIGNAAPPRFDDKTYGRHNNSNPVPYDPGWSYWLIPPFLIGASTAITVYIIIHCIYFHCYTTKKLNKMAERNPVPTIVISDDQLSSQGSYSQICSEKLDERGTEEADDTASTSGYFLCPPSDVLPSSSAMNISAFKNANSLQIPSPMVGPRSTHSPFYYYDASDTHS